MQKKIKTASKFGNGLKVLDQEETPFRKPDKLRQLGKWNDCEASHVVYIARFEEGNQGTRKALSNFLRCIDAKITWRRINKSSWWW